MSRILTFTIAVLFASVGHSADWFTIEGQIIYAPPPIVRKPIDVAKVPGCNNNGPILEDSWIINPKNAGLKNVFVWLAEDAPRGTPFPQNKIHPALLPIPKVPVIIDQPCCKFVDHATAARVGQTLIIKNTSPIPHNAKWDSSNNGQHNPLIPPGGMFQIPNPLVLEPKSRVITLSCAIHPWMNAWIRTFDHPYFAITDDDGKFVIKNAPAGKFRLFISHPVGGWKGGADGSQGQVINLAANTDLKAIPYP